MGCAGIKFNDSIGQVGQRTRQIAITFVDQARYELQQRKAHKLSVIETEELMSGRVGRFDGSCFVDTDYAVRRRQNNALQERIAPPEADRIGYRPEGYGFERLQRRQQVCHQCADRKRQNTNDHRAKRDSRDRSGRSDRHRETEQNQVFSPRAPPKQESKQRGPGRNQGPENGCRDRLVRALSQGFKRERLNHDTRERLMNRYRHRVAKFDRRCTDKYSLVGKMDRRNPVLEHINVGDELERSRVD